MLSLFRAAWDELIGSAFGLITEEMPPYEEVEKNSAGFEIRKYGTLVVAETEYQGQLGQAQGVRDFFFF